MIVQLEPDPELPTARYTEYYPDGSIKGTVTMSSRIFIELWPLMTQGGGWMEIVAY